MLTEQERKEAHALVTEARRTFDACVQRGQAARHAAEPLTAAVWAQVAADFAFHKHPGIFCDPELEALLAELARGLEECPGAAAFPGTIPGDKPRLLHVMTNAYATGGHSRLVQRLALNSSESHRHLLVTTAQRGDLPERLGSVFCSGGLNWVDLSSPGSNLLSRAQRLRRIAREEADVVFLHCHPFDVVPALAFGVPGGPPVVVVNHSDHTFWVGASVGDAVADLRLAGQELTLTRRQGRLSRLLPIPLAATERPLPDRAAARARLGVAEDAVVLLTIASPYKFTPIGGYHFLAAVGEVLRRHPKAVLLACGPSDAGAWKEAGDAVGGRIRPFGVQKDLSDFQAAADIYLDPFPYASLTSMLEVALHAVPVVGRANVTAPTFTDGAIVAGDSWMHAPSLEAYRERLEELILDAELREREGGRLKGQVADRHLMPAWGSYLGELLRALPPGHEVRPLESRPQELDDTDYFLARMAQLTAARYSCNTSLRKHGGCFPAKERCRLLMKGIFARDGIKILPISTYRGKELFS